MIYNTRNRSNDTKESQKECSFSAQSVKNHETKTTYASQYCVRVNMKNSFTQNFLNSLTKYENHME